VVVVSWSHCGLLVFYNHNAWLCWRLFTYLGDFVCLPSGSSAYDKNREFIVGTEVGSLLSSLRHEISHSHHWTCLTGWQVRALHVTCSSPESCTESRPWSKSPQRSNIFDRSERFVCH
jgi:hypothetical protein